MKRFFALLTFGLLLSCYINLSAQTHEQQQGTEPSQAVEPPKVFLDKSPRIVRFQLNRLDNERLLLVERKTDDPKYAPVYQAILTRAGMARQDRDEALFGLTTINKSDAVTELLAALGTLDAKNRQDQRTSAQLAAMLLSSPMQDLAAKKSAFEVAAKSDNALLRPIGYAGLVVAGETSLPAQSKDATLDWLAAVALVPSPKIRAELWPPVSALLAESQPAEVRRKAIEGLAHIPANLAETFGRLAPLVSQSEFRDAAVKTLLTIPPKDRSTGSGIGLGKGTSRTCRDYAGGGADHAGVFERHATGRSTYSPAYRRRSRGVIANA